MRDTREKLEALLASLATERDELRLQLHLLKAEAREEWDAVEKKWAHFESRMERAGKSVRLSAGEIGAASETVAEEIGNAYRRLKQSLK
ncbi:MAG: hypothetical protein H6993_18620 [Pseudomonadales bacterium]|nr:hypothetical protein [Pseudomonadales bacterium]MCP5185987.1 hypothetical protein [Pseudomonadales bacterium]